jgi:hypothetical protein
MGEKHTIEVKNPRLGNAVMMAVGISQVLDALLAQPEFQRLPGFNLADTAEMQTEPVNA